MEVRVIDYDGDERYEVEPQASYVSAAQALLRATGRT